MERESPKRSGNGWLVGIVILIACVYWWGKSADRSSPRTEATETSNGPVQDWSPNPANTDSQARGKRPSWQPRTGPTRLLGEHRPSRASPKGSTNLPSNAQAPPDLHEFLAERYGTPGHAPVRPREVDNDRANRYGAPPTRYYPPSNPTYTAPLPLYPSGPQCAENGSCFGDTSSTTGRPKTTHVRGYTRKDGTYVRGHYRSH